jgi:putative transposase
MVVVHAADIQDRDGAKLVLEQVKGAFPRLQLIWADAGYSGKLIEWVKITCGWVLEIVKRRDNLKEFQALRYFMWVTQI